MARDPTIAYVLLRNAHFGPRSASSVELCVRDLVRHSRYSGSTFVVCPDVDQPFAEIETKTIPRVWIGGNLAKAWRVGQLLRRNAVDLAIVENHLPAAAFIASAGLPTILHSHAYEKAPSGAVKRAVRDAELRRLAGIALVSEDCVRRFHANFPSVRAPMRTIPNGLNMAEWSARTPKQETILSIGRALDNKGHIEAVRAIAKLLPSRPGWTARFILSATEREPKTVQALRAAAAVFDGRVTIDANAPYAEVKAAWQTAAIGLVLTKTPEPFGRTALEAMASGAALVTSGRGGLAEICGSAAVIVDPVDHDGLAAELASLMDSPELRAKFAHAGRARVETLFDISVVAKRMDDFVDETLGAS
jgi:glycosyltransferase involved in cell wall biosynthesis